MGKLEFASERVHLLLMVRYIDPAVHKGYAAWKTAQNGLENLNQRLQFAESRYASARRANDKDRDKDKDEIINQLKQELAVATQTRMEKFEEM